MLGVQNSDLDKYIETYKKLSISDKHQIIEDELKVLIAIFEEENKKKDSNSEMLFNMEIFDTKKDNYTEHDFAESVFVYINILKESIGEYLLNNDR